MGHIWNPNNVALNEEEVVTRNKFGILNKEKDDKHAEVRLTKVRRDYKMKK